MSTTGFAPLLTGDTTRKRAAASKSFVVSPVSILIEMAEERRLGGGHVCVCTLSLWPAQ